MSPAVRTIIDKLFSERKRHYWSLDYETTTGKLLDLIGVLEKTLEESVKNKEESLRHHKSCMFHDDFSACNCGAGF